MILDQITFDVFPVTPRSHCGIAVVSMLSFRNLFYRHLAHTAQHFHSPISFSKTSSIRSFTLTTASWNSDVPLHAIGPSLCQNNFAAEIEFVVKPCAGHYALLRSMHFISISILFAIGSAYGMNFMVRWPVFGVRTLSIVQNGQYYAQTHLNESMDL